jgi:hypothetical protein
MRTHAEELIVLRYRYGLMKIEIPVDVGKLEELLTDIKKQPQSKERDELLDTVLEHWARLHRVAT